MRKVFFSFILFFCIYSPLWAAIDTIAVDVGISVFKTMPLGVVPFEEKNGPIAWGEMPPHKIHSDAIASFGIPIPSS